MLQFITQETNCLSHIESAKLALSGGCKWVQLRMKNASPTEVEEVAWEVKKLCNDYNAVFIIDDYVNVAKIVNADGVHLGKNDMPIKEARRYLGDSFIIGGTANSFEDIKHLYHDGVNYIGCGPFRFTTTKKNLSPILGEDGLRKIILDMNKENIDVPLVAIGGIERSDISSLFALGVNGIALSGSVLNANNPSHEIALILKEINRQVYG